MSVDSATEILQRVFPMQAARLHDRQNPFDELAARLTVAAEAAPTPQHGPTQQTLHVVVGRLNAFTRRERPQRALHLQQVPTELRHARIVSQAAFQQRLAQPTLERLDPRLQLLPRDFSFLKRMPRGKQFFDDAKPPAAHKNAWAAQVHDFLKIAFQMGPAKLATVVGDLQVHIPTVAVQNAVDVVAQQSRQTQSTAFGMDDEDGDVRRGRRACAWISS